MRDRGLIRGFVTALLLLGVVLAVAVVAWRATRESVLPAAERGRRLAERTGCFGCHGPEGRKGSPNPGRKDATVPSYGNELMMYVDSTAEIREWIEDGQTRAKAASQTWRAERARGTLRMPAFRRRLSPSEIDALVAFVEASSGWPEPEDSLAQAGLDRADALGCTGCHGRGGRFARPNPGSFKGYVPSWDGPDFAELVRNRTEFDQWVTRGISARFARQRMARLFLDRAVLRMPAFEHHLDPGDLDRLWDYVEWLRQTPRPAPAH